MFCLRMTKSAYERDEMIVFQTIIARKYVPLVQVINTLLGMLRTISCNTVFFIWFVYILIYLLLTLLNHNLNIHPINVYILLFATRRGYVGIHVLYIVVFKFNQTTCHEDDS